ncbi:polyol transporter 5 [Brassica rapa]|uniref:BnaA01g26430D protein n=3 Tax=Brassica TaxID=3705 RepID=A0A078G0M9_BRANA|nr:polyol transporter 5 [Brassica rapa]XP_013721513.2 polyol transporter 5-like [Brassica napus]KAH0943406.1 hypothetical protein HID58_003043 [Brassica napus]CAF2154094.1 unnamed protein product [Brassica napus]CDY18552.1 BnaA01g26430D [Brassica napus]
MTGLTPENQTVPTTAPATKHVPELGPPVKPKRNKYAFACAILASMTSILLGYDIGVMSGALIYIKRDFKITDLQVSILAGILNIFSLIGSCAAGKTSDWIGRRNTIVFAGAIFFAGAILMGLAPNYAFLMFGRFVAGVGVGYALMIAPVYTAEVAPASSRGFLTSFPEVFINAGIMLGYVSNLAFSKFPLKLGWRFMLGVGSVPSVLLAIGVLAMPESPRWLVIQGRLGEAKRVLDRTSDSPSEAALRLEEIKEAAGIPADCHDEVVQVSRKTSHGSGVWKELLIRPTPAVRRVMIAAMGIHFFQQATGIDAVVLFSPRIFKTAGLKTDHQQLLATVAVGIVKTSFILVATFLIDRVGRRPLLLTSVGGMILSLAALGTSLTIIDHTEKKVTWALVLSITTVMTYVATFSIGAGPITWVYTSEIFPLRLRSQGSSMAVVVNRVTSGVISMTFLLLSEAMTTGGAFYLFGGIATVAWVFFYTFLPETQGRSLEDMDELFSGFRWRDSKSKPKNNKNSSSNPQVEIGPNKL